jgi:hypothetical protein
MWPVGHGLPAEIPVTIIFVLCYGASEHIYILFICFY